MHSGLFSFDPQTTICRELCSSPGNWLKQSFEIYDFPGHVPHTHTCTQMPVLFSTRMYVRIDYIFGDGHFVIIAKIIVISFRRKTWFQYAVHAYETLLDTKKKKIVLVVLLAHLTKRLSADILLKSIVPNILKKKIRSYFKYIYIIR